MVILFRQNYDQTVVFVAVDFSNEATGSVWGHHGFFSILGAKQLEIWINQIFRAEPNIASNIADEIHFDVQ